MRNFLKNWDIFLEIIFRESITIKLFILPNYGRLEAIPSFFVTSDKIGKYCRGLGCDEETVLEAVLNLKCRTNFGIFEASLGH